MTGGYARARRVLFRHQPISAPRIYRRYFGCEILFGETADEYVDCAGQLGSLDGVDALEMNASCPNIKKGGVEFGVDPVVLKDLVRACRGANFSS